MREIKGRFWDGEQMFYFTLEDIFGGGIFIARDKLYRADIIHPAMKKMLPTGLKDKTGREVYEGDIIQQMMPSGYDGPLFMRKEVVAWDEENACFNPFNYGDYSYDATCEIIGDIYKNRGEA